MRIFDTVKIKATGKESVIVEIDGSFIWLKDYNVDPFYKEELELIEHKPKSQ